MKKVRIVDVATHAGVSKSTVSQYLNGRFGHMSEQTKQKIKQTIKELNYVPNPIARSLKQDKTFTIGVVVRDISGFNTSRVLRGIDDFCKKNSYKVLIYNSDFDEESEKNALLTLQQMCVDAIVITSSGLNSALINQLVSEKLPIVQFQLEYPDCQTHIVLSDYEKASFDATEHLIKLGHSRIGFLAQEFGQSVSRNARYQGYLTALQHHGIEQDPTIINFWDRQAGFSTCPIEMINRDNPPTALFSQHLAITTDLLNLLNSRDISIPEQVSVLGFDEIPMVELFKVPVTVIKQNAYQIGVETAKLALAAIANPKLEQQRHIVQSTLVHRDSCRSIVGSE
jgi:DNA-binding LacI/PurR family transcriptional regulator